MNATRTPTDSVLRRHFESSLQDENFRSYPQDSTLIRHHEQMRAAGLASPKPKRPDEFPDSTASSVGRHPLAVHLEMKSDWLPSAGVQSPPAARKPKPRTSTPTPPEDSTLARHFAQMHDVSYAEHPLATHLRRYAPEPQNSSAISSSEAELSMVGGAKNAHMNSQDADASTAASNSGQDKKALRTEPDESGWLRRLVRSIIGKN